MTESCCSRLATRLVRLPDGNAIDADAIRAVRALPRSRDAKNQPVPAQVVLWLDGADVLRIDQPSFRAACWARDRILDQLAVPEFPEYVPEAGEDELPTIPDLSGSGPVPVPTQAETPSMFDGPTEDAT